MDLTVAIDWLGDRICSLEKAIKTNPYTDHNH